ncbi:MAG: sensory box protein [Herminiimonas sp.]|nr:sensory box protein [Herminiimonas sp.]
MVAHYQIGEYVGTTAGSRLYHGRRLDDGTPALLKVCNADDSHSAPQLSHFQREYVAFQLSEIPGLITPIALLNEDGQSTMVLQDFAGESLESVLCGHRLDVPTCIGLGREFARILAGMHATHIIHRDIRPVNFMLDTRRQQLRLVDLSRAAFDTQEVTMPSNEVPGDWAYVSPEQTGRMNRSLDYRTDFYSLGITLFRMLTGQLPFVASTPLEWTHCHIARSPPAPRDIAPEIPQPVSDIVMRLLAKLPEDRYQSAHGLQVDLEQCLAQWQSSAQIASFPLGTEDVPTRLHIPDRLYGRESESATLFAAFDRMAATGQPALVTVSGDSGIGKSSLVHELQRPIVRHRGYFISGKFDQYQGDIPYATITQAFRELVQQLLTENDVRIACWRQRLEAAVGVNGQLIVDVLPQVELIIGPQSSVPVLPPTEAQNRFRMVFRQFVGVFTSKEHPLVLFLDDLQWIDAASLSLIEHLLTYPETHYLLVIGSYRDNQVSTAHQLLASLKAIRQSGAVVTDVRLVPLSVTSLNQLVADTLYAEPAACEPLTRLIFEKTEGNPFFFTQFLYSLQQEGLLQQAAQQRGWHWDLRRIKARDFADNVVDLMLGKLRRLPVETQDSLRLAACLGNKFERERLALVSRRDAAELESQLSMAEQEGLLTRTSATCKFLHDRIQQAAYSLIPEGERAAVHLKIAYLLSARAVTEELGEQVFEVVNHFNRGAGLITSTEDRKRVARFNLVAGKRAKTAAAYTSGLTYLAAGRALLTEDCWEQCYPLIFALEFHLAECEFLSSDLPAAERRLAMLSARAATLIDSAAVTRLRLELYTTLDRSDRCVELCLEYLRRIGVQWSPHPTKEEVRTEYAEIWRRIGSRTVEELVDLPLMSDPEWRATLDVLAQVVTPALFTDENFLCLALCRMANISLEHGNSDASCFAYVWLGMILGPHFDDYLAAFRFGQVGFDLVEQRGLDRFEARVYMSFGNLVNPWTRHVRVGRPLVRRAFDTASKIGDLTFAAYSCNNLITNLLASGEPLTVIQQEAETGLAFARKIRFGLVSDIITSQLRLILTLRGLTPQFNSFNDEQFDEARFEQHFEAEPRLALACCWYWIRKLQARFYAGDYASAVDAESRAQRLLWTSPSFFEVAEYRFYAALARAARCDTAMADQRSQHMEALVAHHRQLEIWAHYCPENFENRTALVGAEIARLEGRDLDAIRLYERAIQSARENGFVQNAGVAHELAAGFYLARGSTTAGIAHLGEARSCFARWGADGKVKQLDARYPQLLGLSTASSAVSLGDNVAQLDLVSVAKASQAISGQIVLDELIDTLMRIVLENAGAQTGYLLLTRGEELTLAAEANVEQQTVQVRVYPGQALPGSPLPASILSYVRRSREQVVLADVAQPNPFSNDDYFARQRPKSVLCLPILRQAALLGVLYLENRLVTHAFTPERVTVLELLASQAAISLESALLYADLRTREARIRRLVESNIIGIFFWNLGGDISDANDALLHIVGYRRDELLSGSVRWADLTPPEYRATDERKSAELRTTGTCVPYEKEFIRKDGRRVPVLVGGALFEKSQENGVAFVLDLTDRKQAEDRIRYMAHYDALTGLPNRELLQDRIRQAIAYAARNGTQVAVFSIDLDYFKHINDSLGHRIGDRLLQMMAARLREALREGDSVTRPGGDRYVLCLPLVTGAGEAALVATKVLDAVRQPFLVEGNELHASASLGISLFPDDGVDVETLMRSADTAMDHAKERGRGNFQFFTQALNKTAQQRRVVENRLRHALAKSEFVLHYQPQVDIASGAIFSSEALLRWCPPGKAPISCGGFISIAEQTSLIVSIGEWVLREACRQLKQWQDAGHPALRIAVNLSPRQFYQPHIFDMIVAILNETRLAATSLELEITEGLLLQGSDEIVDTLNRLSGLGIQLSLDDFGTGYSSLAYLQRFPLHALKIDQSFIRNIGRDQNATALVTAILAMANSLNMNVLAEGVETWQQMDFLRAHGCPSAQGFYYSEAVPADVFIRLLDN